MNNAASVVLGLSSVRGPDNSITHFPPVFLRLYLLPGRRFVYLSARNFGEKAEHGGGKTCGFILWFFESVTKAPAGGYAVAGF